MKHRLSTSSCFFYTEPPTSNPYQSPGQAQTSIPTPKSEIAQGAKPPSIMVGIPSATVGDVTKVSLSTSPTIDGSSIEFDHNSINKELILKDILKEKEYLVHENGLLRDHLAVMYLYALLRFPSPLLKHVHAQKTLDIPLTEFCSQINFHQ